MTVARVATTHHDSSEATLFLFDILRMNETHNTFYFECIFWGSLVAQETTDDDDKPLLLNFVKHGTCMHITE